MASSITSSRPQSTSSKNTIVGGRHSGGTYGAVHASARRAETPPIVKTTEPVPIGVAGELYLGGPKVTCGYIGGPDLTDAAFVHVPELCPEGRLYKTGDRVRWLASGNLEFLGRIDHQVKLNGLRIELGEIEAVLRQHEGIRDAAVVVKREPSTGREQLVGYVLPAGADIDGARAECARVLPVYMVPTAIVAMEEYGMKRRWQGPQGIAAIVAMEEYGMKRRWQGPQGIAAIVAMEQILLATLELTRASTPLIEDGCELQETHRGKLSQRFKRRSRMKLEASRILVARPLGAASWHGLPR
eukprot:gene6732-8055_t